MWKNRLSACVLFVSLIVFACRCGGGGGGGGDNGGGGATNNRPTWSTIPANITITGGSVYSQTNGVAQDADAGQTLTCSKNGSSCSFTITVSGSGLPANCSVSFTASLAAGTCNLRISATDNGSPALSVGATISITTKGNHAPTWSTAPSNITITGGTVYNHTNGVATDVDTGQTLTCSNNGTSCGFSATVAGSGLPANCNVSFTAPGSSGTCNLRIMATDNGSPAMSVGATISITTVTNHAPTWSTAPSNITITGGSAYNHTNGVAQDADAAQTLTCSNNGNSCGFSVTVTGSGLPANCNISFTAPVPAGVCNLRIAATDNGSPALSVGATISITLKNHAPTWSTTPSNITITGGTVYNHTNGVATDVDTGQTLTCSNNGTSCGFSATVTGSGLPANCNVSFTASVSSGTCNLRIMATDNGSPAMSVGATISITTVTNHAPTWSTAPSNITITGGSVYNQTNGVAQDADAAQTLTCSNNGTSCGFTVTVSGSGLPANCSLNFTAPTPAQTCNLRITATDNGSPALSVGATISITVKNHKPTWTTMPSQIVITGGSIYNQTNGVAQDVDTGQTLTCSGSTNCGFAITVSGSSASPVNCNVSFTAQMPAGSCNLRIMATDSGSPAMSVGSTISISVKNHKPTWSLTITNITITGGSVYNQANWVAQDVDTGQTLTCSKSGAGATCGFAVTVTGSGLPANCNLSFTAPVAAQTCNLRIVATDNGSPAMSVGSTVWITIRNHAPTWSTAPVNISITGGSVYNKTNGVATDVDTSQTLSCSKNGSSCGFTVTVTGSGLPANCNVSFTAQVSAGTCSLRIMATDSGSPAMSVGRTMSITIRNHAPTWSGAPSNITLTAGSSYNKANGEATDLDTTQTLTCSSNGTSCGFSITVSGSGTPPRICNVSFTAPSSPSQSCSLRVMVSDNGSPTYTIGSTISISSIVPMIAAGYEHTCALKTNGEVKCWGYNGNGQLGNNSTTNSSTPVNVCNGGVLGCSISLLGVAAIAAGYQHTCALTMSGGVKCWGNNAHGQLGDSTTNQRNTPVDVCASSTTCSGKLSGVIAITAGDYHTCALLTTGAVYCWGYNGTGQLGDNGAETESWYPVAVWLTTGAVAIDAGDNHTCAITSVGSLKCWGYNLYGQLGDSTTTDRYTPVLVCSDSLCGSSLPGVGLISGGETHTCASSNGNIECWGNNSYGRLGDGTTTNSYTPVSLSGLSGVLEISSGYFHTCAMPTGGGVECWGDNSYGEVGDNTTTNRHSPVYVCTDSTCGSHLSGVGMISGGGLHTCALIKGSGVKCWGYNYYGELGDGTTTDRHAPVWVTGL